MCSMLIITFYQFSFAIDNILHMYTYMHAGIIAMTKICYHDWNFSLPALVNENFTHEIFSCTEDRLITT